MTQSRVLRRFMASTAIDYEQWHDGLGYDLDALGALDDDERAEVERWILDRGDRNWRDVEALVAIGTPKAMDAARAGLRADDMELVLAAARYLPPDPKLERERESAIAASLGDVTAFGGLSQALDLAEAHRTPKIVQAVFRAALRPDGEVAVNAAALAAYLSGKAKEAFDWDLRPLFLRFNTTDDAARAAAFRDLCALCGVDPAPYLAEATDPT